MASIIQALGRIKQEPLRVLGTRSILRVCREIGHRWRDRLPYIHLYGTMLAASVLRQAALLAKPGGP